MNKQWDQHFRATKQKYEQKVGLGARVWVVGGHISAGRWLWGLGGDWVQGKVSALACTSFIPGVGPCAHANVPAPSRQVTDLHQELAEARRALTELESEREQKQRDFDRKLLLAKSRIETEEASPSRRVAGSPAGPVVLPWLIPPPWILQAEKERLAMEVRDLQQRMRFLQEQLAPVTRQREYQEKEIQRLNKVGAQA